MINKINNMRENHLRVGIVLAIINIIIIIAVVEIHYILKIEKQISLI